MPMRRRITCAALLAACAAIPVARADGSPAALLTAWAEAFAAQDGARSAALYTDDASLWGTTSREQSSGRAAITRYFGPMPNITARSVTFGDHTIRPVADTIAIASGQYTFVLRRADGTELRAPARFSMTLVKVADGAWRIADQHSSLMPRPPP